jgi:hypothetical protein
MMLAMPMPAHLLNLTLILGVSAPSSVLAGQPPSNGLQCTHVWTFEGVEQVREPIVVGPNSVASTRKSWIDALGEPTIERQIPYGVALAWLETSASSTVRHIDIQAIDGALHVTCGLSF